MAENSGGAHCFKYGFTTNYVTGLELVLPDGELVQLGGKELDHPGSDLLGAFVGSEGTLGIATKIWLRIVPKPETVRTLVALLRLHRSRPARWSRRSCPRGIVPGRHRDDGQPLDPGRRGRHRTPATRPTRARRWWSSWTARRPSARRASTRSWRSASGPAPTRSAWPQDEAERELIWKSAQGGLRRDGPDRAQLLRAGQRDPAHAAGRGAGADRGAGARVRPAGGQRLPRRRRQPAPARLLRRLGAGRGRARRGVRGHDRQGLRGRGRLDHRRARRGRGQEALHARDVQRRRPGRVPAAALRVRPRPARQPRQGDAHAAAVRRGARAPTASTRSSRPAWRSASDGDRRGARRSAPGSADELRPSWRRRRRRRARRMRRGHQAALGRRRGAEPGAVDRRPRPRSSSTTPAT